MRVAILCVAFGATLSAVAPASAAENNLKGTYYLVGTQVCLVSPAGFKQDSKGNYTIPIGETNYSQLTTEGLVTYRGDGTGEAKQTFVTIVPPPNAYGTAVAQVLSPTRSLTSARESIPTAWPSRRAVFRAC